MTDSWKSEGGQRKNRLVDATHDITNQIITTDPYLGVDDKEGIYFNKEGAPSILGVGTKTPFSRLSFGDYRENNLKDGHETSANIVNNPAIAFSETSSGTNATGISFYRKSAIGTTAETRGLRFVVNNKEDGLIKDTGLVPGPNSINVGPDNTSMLITNDGQNRKVFINSNQSQFANSKSGLEVNGDCRITKGLVLKGQQTQEIKSETGLIFYDENEKILKYSTGTTGDDIYNLMAQNSSGHILGVSGEYAINFQDYSANVGLVQDISSGGILFAFKDVGFIIGNGDMFKTYSDGTHLSGTTFGTGSSFYGVGKQNIPALAVIGHNQPGGTSANGNVIVSHISDVEPIPIISLTEKDMSANGVIYLQNNVAIGVKQPMAVIDVSKIDVPLLRMGSNVQAYYNSIIVGKDISGSSNSFYFGQNIENKANYDSSFNLIFGKDITINNSDGTDFEENFIFGNNITVSKNNNFVFGNSLALPEDKDLSFCVLLGKNGTAERGDLIRYFENSVSVFKLTSGGNMDILGNMIIRKDISANDASFNNLDVKNIRNVDFLAVTDISSINVTVGNKLAIGHLDASGNSKTHPNFALDVSGGLNLTGYADMDDYVLKINKTNSVESGKILAGKLDLSHNNLIRASLDASGSILILNNEGEEGLTNLYGRTILQNDLSGNTILTADGNGVTNATKIHMKTFQNNNIQNEFVFDGSGNFGLGTSAPQAKFHLFDGVGYEPNHGIEGIQMGKHSGTGDYNLIINTDEDKKAIIGFSDISNNSNKAHIQYDNLTNVMNINSTNSVQINRNNVLMVEIDDVGLKIPTGTLDAKYLKIDGATFDTEASSAWTSTHILDLSNNKQSLFVPFNIGINQKEVTGINNYQVKFNLDISGNVRTNDLFFGKIYINMIPKILTARSTTIQNNLYGSGSYKIVEEDDDNSNPALKMFDNDDNSYWSILSDAAVDVGVYYTTLNEIDTEISLKGKYFEINLPHRWCLKKYGFKSTPNNTKMPEKWKVIAKIGLDTGNVEDISNNLWRLVDEKDISDNNYWTDQSMNYFPVETSKYSNDSYRIFRFYFIKTFDGDISQNDIEICGMEMYGETNKISDISSNLIQTEIQDISSEKHLSLQPLGGRVGIGTTTPAEHVILDISSTGAIRLPIGGTSERPSVDVSGCLRYNDEKKQFEGYGENGWAGLGGVISNNQLITIKADDTNGLTFLTDEGGVSTERMRLDNSGNIGLGTDTTKDRVILDISASGAIRLPMGNDAERPATVDASGCLRYNTYTKQFEGYGDGGWAGLGGVVDKNLNTYITAEEYDDEDKLRFYTGKYVSPTEDPEPIQRLSIDTSGNIDISGVLKVKGFISEHKDVIDKTVYGGETGTELFVSAKYGHFDIDYIGDVYTANSYSLPIKAYPGSVLQFNLLGFTAITKLVTNAGLDPSGLVFVDNDNNITSGNGSGHTKGTFIWHVPFDTVGNFRLENVAESNQYLSIMIKPLNSDLSSNNILVNQLHSNEIKSSQIIMGKDNASNGVIIDISASGAIRLPMGNDDERPATVDASGCLRYNTETKQFEGYGDGGWAGLGGVVDKDLDTYITAEKNADEDKLRFYTGDNEQLVIDVSGNIDISGVLKVKGFISEHKDVIEKTIYGGETGTELFVSAKYGHFDIDYIGDVYTANSYSLPIKAYPGSVLQFNLLGFTATTKLVTNAGLDPSGLVFVDNDNNITSGNGSGHTKGTFIWHVPFDAIGNFSLENVADSDQYLSIMIKPLNSDISSNEISGNHIFANVLSSNNATITTLGSTDINTTTLTAAGDIILGENTFNGNGITVNEISCNLIKVNQVEAINLSSNNISGTDIDAQKLTLTSDLSGNNARLHDVSVNRLWIGDIEMIGQVSGNISNPTSVGTLAGNFVVDGDMSGNDASFNVVDTSQLSISNSSLKLGGGAVPGNIKYESGKFYGYNESKWAGLGGVISDSERVYVDASDNSGLTFFTDNGGSSLERMRILNDGYVGIGESSPKTKLHISNGHINIEGDANSGDSPKGVFFKNGGVARTFYISGESGGANTSVRHLYLGYSDTLPENFSDSTFTSGAKMVIRGDGYVGIGTTSPSYKLDVNGTICIQNDTNIQVGGSSSSYVNTIISSMIFKGDRDPRYSAASIYDVGRICYKYDNSVADTFSGGAAFVIETREGWKNDGSLTERMRVASNGNVGIGTTSPEAKLDISGGHLLISDVSENSAVIELSTVDENKADCIMGTSVGAQLNPEENVTFSISNGTFTQSPGSITKSGGSSSWIDNAASSHQQVTYQDRDLYDYVDFSWKRNQTGSSDNAIGGLLINGWSFDNNASQYRHLRYIAYIGQSNIFRYYYQIEGNSTADTDTVVSNDTDLNTIITLRIHFAHSPLNTYNEDRVQILINGVLSYTFEGSVVSGAGGGTMQALSESDYPVRLGINIYDNGNGFNSIKIKKVSIQQSLLTYNSRSINSLSNSYNFNIKSIPETTNRGSDALENIVSQITAGDSALYIESNKNVGIGTNLPTSALTIKRQISGTATAQGTGAQMIDFKSYLAIEGHASSPFDPESVKSSIYSGVAGTPNTHTRSGFMAFMTADEGTLYERLRINYDGNVGIGTSSPYAKLTLGFNDTNQDSGELASPDLHLSNFTASKCYIGIGRQEYREGHKKLIGFGYVNALTSYYPAYIGYVETEESQETYGDLIFGTRPTTGGTTEPSERMRIDSDGNVGIGVTPSGYKLDVGGSLRLRTDGDCLIRMEADTDNANEEDNPLIWMSNDGNADYNFKMGMVGSSGQIFTDSLQNGGFISSYQTIQLATGTSPAARLTVLQNGNVGIGTDDPDKTLHLHDDTRVDIKFSNTGDEDHYIRKDGNYLRFRGHDDSTILFELKNNSDGSNSCNFPSGRVGICEANPGSPLHVKATTSYEGIILSDENSQIAKIARGSSTGSPYINLYTNSSPTSGSSLKVQIQGDDKSYFNGGFVGIGVTNPAYPLTVYGNTWSPNGQIVTYYYYGSSPGPSGGGSLQTTAYFEHRIWAKGMINNSDIRIKENFQEINDKDSLQKVRDISCVWYNYIDKTQEGNVRVAGFIAQQVKEHLPEAVSLQKEFIPNEMRNLEDISWNGTDMSCDLGDVSGVKYRFYVSNDLSGNEEEMKDIVGNENNSFTFDASYNNIFCYGKEVDDFHTIDKNRIFAVAFSATQEIDRIQQAEKTKLAAAETEITTLKDKVASLETTITDLVARLTALETA